MFKKILKNQCYFEKNALIKKILKSSNNNLYEKHFEKLFENFDFKMLDGSKKLKFTEKLKIKKFQDEFNEKLRGYRQNLIEEKKDFYELEKKFKKDFNLLDECKEKFSDINFEILKK